MALDRKGKSKAIEVIVIDSDSSSESSSDELEFTPLPFKNNKDNKLNSKKKSPAKAAIMKEREPIIAISSDEEDGEEEETDEAVARKLQASLDQEVNNNDDLIDSNQASTSASTSKSIYTNSNSRLPRGKANPAVPSKTAEIPSALILNINSSDLKDPRTMLAEYRDLFVYSSDSEKKCSCDSDFLPPYLASALSTETSLLEYYAASSLTCSNFECSKKICRGCWELFQEEDVGRSVGKCCSESRVIVLFEVLSALDTLYLQDRLHKPLPVIVGPTPTSSNKQSKPYIRKKPLPKNLGSGAGTGYGSGVTGAHFFAGLPTFTGGEGEDYFDDEDDEGLYDGYDSEDEDGYEEAMMERQMRREAMSLAAKVPVLVKLTEGQQKAMDNDTLYLVLLDIILEILPSPNSSTAKIYDYLPHTSLFNLIQLSTLSEYLLDLLRNDSVEEWIDKAEIYFKLLAILMRFSESENLLEGLFGERRDKKWSEGISRWMNEIGEIEWERKEVVKPTPIMTTSSKKGGKKRKVDETDLDSSNVPLGPIILVPSLFSYLKRLVTQAEAFRKAASTTSQFEEKDSGLIGLCGDISSTGDRLKEMLEVWQERKERDLAPSDERIEQEEEDVMIVEPKVDTRLKGKGKALSQSSTSAMFSVDPTWSEYSNACRSLAYESVILSTEDLSGLGGKSFLGHYNHKDLVATANSRRPAGGFIHLAKELAILSTNLPPGIWLRVDEARIDCIKVMISGAEGSPYAYGLFEFDIFIPLNYPQVPPIVNIKNTGNGAVRFNPNLYADGKVCLSLLGTWPGAPHEMWQPSKSTILQVLISIQSMMLATPLPYFNEPGMGTPCDSKASKDYNSNITLATIKWSIVNWMTPAFKESVWADVIAMHFTFNQHAITRHLDLLKVKDPRILAWVSQYNGLAGSLGGVGLSHQAYVAQILAANPAMNLAQKNQLLASVGLNPGAPLEQMQTLTSNLVSEFETGCKEVAGWKGESWFTELLK